MPPRTPIVIDPTQPLPRLTLEEPWSVKRTLTWKRAKPGLLQGKLSLDPSVEGSLQDMRAANVLIGSAQTFPRVFLDEIGTKFAPVKGRGGMGCMQACYGVLDILYTEKVAKDLRMEVWKRAWAKAEAYAKAHPDELKAKVAEAMAADAKLTKEKAEWKVKEKWTSPHNTSDHLFALMGERGLAEKKVKTPDAKADETIRRMTGDLPGLYFFGMAVNDNHTVTLAVERAADGSQRMYWLDQNQPGLSREIEAGKLGAELQGVHGFIESTNIYAFRPPATGGT